MARWIGVRGQRDDSSHLAAEAVALCRGWGVSIGSRGIDAELVGEPRAGAKKRGERSGLDGQEGGNSALGDARSSHLRGFSIPYTARADARTRPAVTVIISYIWKSR